MRKKIQFALLRSAPFGIETFGDQADQNHEGSLPSTLAISIEVRQAKNAARRRNQDAWQSPHSIRHFSRNCLLILMLLILSLLSKTCHAQIGVTVCACQPASYTFQFNFSDVCGTSDVMGPGVVDSSCTVGGTAGTEGNVTNLKPVFVSSVQILELDQFQAPLAFASYNDGYVNGDTITYTSVAGTTAGVNNLTLSTIPKGLQLNIQGINSEDQGIVNFWIILFDNNCGLFPVLKAGEHIGWTGLVSA